MRSEVLRPATILRELKRNRVTHLIWLPDSETNFMYRRLVEDGSMDLVPVCREGESIAIAAGLWIGGKLPVVLIQNTGLFESGDSVRGVGLDVGLPLVMMVGYRGWTRHGVTIDSAARFTEPILHTWGIDYYLVESDEDVGRISIAFDEAQRTRRPVAVLVGSEYAEM
jgi:sulfopyruvate decarboxylase TPP-binding subunit